MPSENFDEWDKLREKIIGFGEKSIQKSYYPELQERLNELERFKTLLDQANDAIFLIKLPQAHIYDLNHSAYVQLGYFSHEILKKPIFELINSEDHHVVKDIFLNIEYYKINKLQHPEGQNFEINFIKKDSSNITMEVNISIVNFSGSDYAVMVARDITERKLSEEKIKASLEEKKVLLKEIHHRVKNNLQIISSLLSLQSDNIKDNQDKKIFKESQDRIKSMALIHEQLYQSKDLARINFATYVNNMMVYLFHSYSMDKMIDLKLDLDNINLEIETAIPCGLIINELVSNSLKHAFKGRNTGEIFIKFKMFNENLVLELMDDGIGFNDNEIYESNSLGLKLVTILVEQLDGELEITHENGSEFIIKFKEHIYNPRI
ncbi:sensor histidine kinase [Methanobacterium alcaliphilum]|uniref:sensor histidine kinase n=1 Tax=Methanobacterium alcaliphilum TaxID=392018 RepID=UPI00200AD92D|nr:histidine kinase dimerization/phosphoacceptor domain -containing protein [Methanobacterium alcaliphilum]MCK9150344.1 PAS domain S-box protein [Methanobacterium alcaliphilum]